eukprot:scaffold250610_cov30-Tisochrysis_lutea.AAC.10
MRWRDERPLIFIGGAQPLLNERVGRVPPQELFALIRQRQSLNRHILFQSGFRLEKAVDNCAAVAIGANTANDAHETPSSAPSRCGFMMRRWALGGAVDVDMPMARRNSPVAPAAGSACPTLALIEPSASGEDGSPTERMTDARDRTSMGSPRLVPVPCASAQATSSAIIAASARAPCSSPT